LVLAALALAVLASCAAWAGEQAAEKALAYVGGEPVTDRDLGRLKTGAMAGSDEAGLLEYAIRRKALVLRALRDGLFKDPAYAEAMQTAREDALVRTLVEKRYDEIKSGISVTDEELAIFAQRMCFTVKFLRSEFGELAQARRFVAKGRAGKARKWEDEVTAAGCEGLSPLMLDTVFSLDEGEEKIIARGRRFTVVRLEEKQKTAGKSRLPDMDSIRDYLIEKKATEALDDWLDKVVGEARVRYVGGD
jgi:hypothetical protein